ncbi:energy transducer TonB [Marinicella rhabdoformis]|uniref:energy transducer TonB n=1 Tax=Marinicella rhabdoformis TaxID=2580566 RepID=UPI0012AEDF66|nr:energy transducer TonB [Marinicella rhabdoformis]
MRLTLIICLIFFCLPVFAQDSKDDEQKKQNQGGPLGLPERTSAPQLNTPVMTSDEPEVVDTSVERPDFGFDESDLDVGGFNPDLDLTSGTEGQTESANDTEIPTEDIGSTDVVTESEPEEEQTDVPKETTEDASPAVLTPVKSLDEYSWHIAQSNEISIPKTLYFSKKQVRLKVTIDPQGQVVKVRGIRNTTPRSVLNYVHQALKSWQFEPPENFGIDKNITKELVIPLVLR